MPDIISSIINDYAAYLKILAWSSPLLFIIGIAVTPFLVALIPEDYFVRETRPKKQRTLIETLLHILAIGLKNILGLFLVLAGLAMLILPGQGILTLLLGIILIDYPGKYAIERKLIAIPAVINSVNWARKKRGKANLQINSEPF